MTGTDNTSLRDFVRVLSDRKKLVLGVVGVAIAIGLAWSLVKSPTYEADAQLEFRDVQEDQTAIIPGTPVVPELRPDQAAARAAQRVTRDAVVQGVQETVNSDLSDDEVRDSITAEVEPDSNLIAIIASTGEAELSADLANEFARQTQRNARDEARERYAQQADQLEAATKDSDPLIEAQNAATAARLRGLSRVADPVEIVRPADVPSSPSSPKPVRDTILAAILGLLVGIAAAFVRNALDRRITDSHQAQHDLGLPLVGYVRDDLLGLTSAESNGGGLVSEDDLEAFRILRRNVDFLAGDQEVSSIVVTSSLPEEGKSTVASWYAYANAVAGRRTLLVECDLRRPVMAKRFGVPSAPGLADYLAGSATPKEVLRPIPVSGREAVDVMPIIPAGDNVFQPTEALASETFKAFADQISRAYDIVIFDSAPLLPVGDTLELIPLMDAILFCVRLDQTTRDQAEAAAQAMRHLPDKPTGLVITGVPTGGDDDYYGYYSYESKAEIG